MDNIIHIYTDGGSRNNGQKDNVGGYGIHMTYNGNVKEIYGSEKDTTNNIQEMKAIIVALETIKTFDKPIIIYSDSAYVINGITNWINGWKSKNWRKSDGKPVLNSDLWKIMDKLVQKQSDIKFVKVKGHSGHVGNERADYLANVAMDIEEGKEVIIEKLVI
jgi:ribonuclease HI